MRSSTRQRWVARVALVSIGGCATGHAQLVGGAYEISQGVIGSGGGAAGGGAYQFVSTSGQVAPATLSAPPYVLTGGVWGASARVADRIFADGFDH
jgi:hypothetical protein